MAFQLKYVDGLPVEGPILDEEALREQEKLTELVLQEYAQSGTLSSQRVCEAVAGFEEYAKNHIKADD